MAETIVNETTGSGLDSSSMDINKGLEQQINNWSTAGTVTPRENNPIDNPVNLPVSTPQINLSSPKPAAESKEDNLVSALKSLSSNIQKGSGYHPEDYVYTSKAALPGDFTRYDEYTPGLDNEQLAYAKQTGVERVGKSVVNMANSFTKTLVESVTAPLVGTAYMLKDATQGEGVFNKAFYDNPYMKMLEKWQGFDLYESKQRRNAAWYSPDYWMTANSLNSVLTTVGDLAAFGVAGEFVFGKALGAAGRPVSKLIDKNYWKAMNALSEFNAVIPTGAEGRAAVQELSQGLKRITEAGMADPEKVNASMKLITDISKRYASQVKTWNRVQQGAAGVVNFLGSAQASALESSTSFRNKMIDKFVQDNGTSPNEEQMMKIDEAANQVGATTGALMTVMGAVTLHGMGKSLFAKKEGESFVRNEIKALSEAAPAEVEILGAKTKVPQYALEAEAVAEPVTKFGKVFKPIRKAGAGALRRLDPMTGIGFLEFGIAPSSVDSYYEKKYLEGDASVINDALLPNVKNMFSKEGATSFFTGLFAGSILKGFQGRKGAEVLDKNTTDALEVLNSTYSKTYLKANVDAIKRGKILRKEYLSAIQDGNKEAELTLRQQMLENWLYPRIKYNSASMIYKELEGYRKIAATDEGIKELQIDGLIPEGDDVQKLRKDFMDHMTYIENYSRAAESYHDALKLKYGAYTDENGEPVFKDEHYEKLMLLSGSIDDANRRLKSLVDDIRSSELSSDPESQRIFLNLIKEFEKMKVTARQDIGEGMSISLSAEKGLGKITTKQTKEIFDRIRDLSINPDKKEELANKFADYLKLNIKKKQYLNEYESIVSNPEIHKDDVVQNITGAPGQADEQEDQEIKEKISLIHGNSPVVDGKVVPSEVELNTEYYVQSKPVLGMYNDKVGTIKDFVKFKIVGQKPDGKLIVTYEKNGDTFTREEDASYFKDKKIAKAADVDKNLPAKFAMDHFGDIFVYSNPNVKLNGETETIGDIFYDPTDKQLKFRYAGKDGKIKFQNVDVKDFAEKVLVDEKTGRKTVVPAKIKYKDSAKRLTPEELDAIKKHKESEADREQRERVAKGKLEIIKELINKKRESLKKVEDAILDHEIDIEEKKSQISSLLEKIESYPLRENRGNLTKDAKKWLEVSMGTVRELGKVVSDIEAKKNELENQQEELQSEIDYLNDIDVTDLPNGRELLKFIQQNTKKLESVILETGAKINSLDSFIKKTAGTIKSLVDRFADYVDRFKQKYPDVPVDTNNLRNFSSSIEEYMDQVASIVGTSSPIIDEMQQMRSAISEMEDLDVPVKLNDIKAAEKQISDLYTDIKDLGKQIKISNELYDAFNKAVEEFDKEQARKALFDSPEAKSKLYAQQRLINQENNKTNPVNDPQEWQDAAKEKHKSTKSIDYVFTASVTPTYENRPEGGWTGPAAEHNNWVDRFNGFMTNRNLGFTETKKKEGERYVTDDADYKANMKVIVVTYNNQKNYFAEDAAFIKPKYEFGSKSVDNAKDKKDATIAYIFTYVAEDGLWFIDKDGRLISKVSEGKADPNQVVFTRMETADAKRDSGYEKYHAEGYTPEQIIEIQKRAEEERGKILEQTGQSGVYDYVESRGVANEEKFTEGENKGKTKPLGTSVVDAKLVPESAIGTGVIVIPTLDTNKENVGYVQAGDNAVPLPVGYPVLVYNNNTAFLSGKKFSPKEVDHLYNTIKRMAEMYLKDGKLDSTISNYLSSVLYFRESYGGEAGNNQFGLDGQGNLLFGINKKAVKFFPDDIEANKVLIKEFLSNANHNVSNGALREKGFNEITGFDKDGEPVIKKWESYENYLLSGKDNEGKGKREGEIPLTVNIKKLENDWESPFKNKYVRPLFGEDYFDKILPEKPKVEEVKPAETKTATSASASAGSKVDVEFGKENTYTDTEGNVINYVLDSIDGDIFAEIDTIVDKDGNKVTNPTTYLRASEFLVAEAKKPKEVVPEVVETVTEPAVEVTETITPEPEVVAQKDPRSTPADIADEYREDESFFNDVINGEISTKDMNGALGELFMEVVPDEKITDVGDRQTEKEFIEAVIPQIKYEELPEFIRTGNGSYAYGMYKNYYISLYKDAPIGTGYHEVWHGVEHSFLDDKTIEKVKQEFFGRTGTFTDRFGREIAYSKPEGVEMKYDSKENREYFEQDGRKVFVANEYDRKERISEEFRQFKADNPAYKKPSLLTNIFKRILNFIKHFVLGKPETIEGIFKKINAGYYRHSKFVKRGFEGPEYSAMKGLPEQTKADILQGVAWKIVDNLRSSHGDLMKIAEGITVQDMFEPVYKQLETYYEDKSNLGSIWGRAVSLIEAVKKENLSPEMQKLQIENIKNETYAARQVWEYMKNNKADVNKDLIDYFKKHKVIFTKDKDFALKQIEESEVETHNNEIITIEYYDDNKDRGYERDGFKIDMKDSAPIEVKLLFSFLTQRTGKNPNANKTFDSELTKPQQKLNSALLPMAVDTSKYIYQVLDEMEGITKPETIKRKLAEMAIKDPVLYALYAPIYKRPETLNDWRLQISFNKFAAKVKPDYVVWRITDDGRSFVMGSNLDTDSRLIVSQWETDMRGDTTGLTVVDRETGIFTLDTKKINVIPGSGSNKEESTIAFLKQLNFPVDSKTMTKLSKTDRAKLITESAELYSVIKKGDQFKPVSTKAIKATALGKIAAILAKTGIVSNPSSHNNVNGDKVQNHIMFNRLNRAMATIVENNTIDKLKRSQPRLFNDTWSKDSMFLKAGGPIYDKEGKLRQEVSDGTFFKMVVAEGLINDKDPKNKTVSTNKMNKAVRFMNMLNMNLGQGESMIFFNFIPADSTTESGVRMEAYVGRKDFIEGTYKKEFNELMSGYLKSEIELIKENMAGTRTLTENARKGDAYKNLQTFKDILVDKDGNTDKELVKKVTEYAQGIGENKDMSVENFIKSIEKQFVDAVDNYFESNTKKEMKFLESYRILDKTSDGRYKFNGLNTDFMEKMKFTESLLTEKQVADVLKYRHINLLIHNTEMRKMFYGPWYEVPDSNKRDKLSMSASEKTYAGDQEFNTWANQNLNRVGDVNLVSGEFGHHVYADDLNVVTYNHDKGIFSAFYDEIKSVIGEEKAEPYKAVEESDAQGIVLDTHWKEYVLRSGDYWSDDYEKQHQFDLASARKEYYARKNNQGYRKELMDADQKIIDAGDPMIYGVGNPKKPVVVGMLNNDSQNIPYSFKTSIMRLSYTVAKQRGLEDLYWWMHDNSIGMVGPKSFQKYGKLYSEEFKGLPELYKMDKDGNPYIGLKDVNKDQLASVKMNINWSDFNKIVEVPKGKSGKTMGSQLRSLAILNSFNYGMPVDFFKEGDNFSEKMSEWSNMNNDQKRNASARYRLYDDNNRAISEISRKGYENALDKLGMTEKNGEFEFTNVNRLVDFLRSEVTRRDLPENVSAGLSWKINETTGEEELAQPLEVLPNYQALKNIIWSVVDKNIIRPKLNGTDLVLVSGAMWEKGIRQSVDKNGKKFLSSSELKFYKKGENGAKTSFMEIYAPNIFREKLAEWKKRNPEKATMSDKELLDYINRTDEGKKLLSAIGFRIPTQGLNSVDAVKIVDFLHPSMGDSIVVPSEIVTKVGADFDVDKMGTYYYNFYINSEGKPKLIEFIEDTQSDASLEKIYNARYTKKERKDIASSRLIADIFEEERMPTLEEFKQMYRGADPYRVNSKEAVENKYYETLQDIVTLPDNYEQLITPNSSKQMTDIESEIARLQTPLKELEKRAERPKGDVNYSKLLDPLNLSNERHDFVEAKGILIGIGAQNNTFHALSQTQPLFVDKFEKMSQEKRKYFSYETGEKDPVTGKPIMGEDYEIYLPHNKINVDGVMKTAYSGVRDSVGNFISDKISQYINGAVDAVKDTWLIRLVKDKDAMGTAIFLDRIGVDPDYVFKFINQPIVQEYIKQQSIAKNVKGINPELSNVYKDNVIANTMKLTYAKDTEKFEPAADNFKIKDLNEMIRLVGQEGKQLNELSAEYRQMQRQILHEYIKYDLMAKDSLADQMAIMWGNISGITDTIIKDKNANYETARDNSVIGAATPILDNTFQGQIKDSANKMMSAINNILRVAASPALKHIEKHFLDKTMFMKADDRTDVLEKATLSLIDFATQTRTKVAGTYLNTRIAELLLNPDKNTAKLLAQMRKDPEIKGNLAELLKNPELLGKLTPFIPIEANRQRTIKIENKPKDSLDSGIFTEALAQLRDNPATNGLYRRLVLTGLIQSGIRDSRSSFNKLIPHEDYMKELIPAVDAILNGNMEKFEETMAFYRNNYQDARVVPNATKSISGANEYVNYYNENNILSNHLPERIKDQSKGAMVSPKFLNVSNRNDLKHPVLKVIVRGVDPETGMEYTSGDIAEMQKKGDYTWATTRLFQKVYDELGSPVVVGVDSYNNKKYLYKQINAWGDGMNVQEYYEEKRPSVLPQHEKVYELEDWQINLALRENRFIEAPKEQAVTKPETVAEVKFTEPAKILDKYKNNIKSFIEQSKYTFVDIPDNFTEEQVNKLFNTPSEIKKYEKSLSVQNFKKALVLDNKYGDIISKNNIIVDFSEAFSNYVEERLSENDKVLSSKEVKDLLVSTELAKPTTQENQESGNKPTKACP